ncbi:unnamed protein product [Medioppia subpectinata]|uniref:Uncharacterized protein n=1 Tax=Medioppia subpectinata TaxID=1979941 RepID=A0A7R9L2V6_9ACAR|nr:unnamed protein product [Medioppia subpectinata]CAG2114553.1 unnamed protein product [Medioppia subpectinata]
MIDPEEEKALRKEMIRSKLDALKAKQSSSESESQMIVCGIQSHVCDNAFDNHILSTCRQILTQYSSTPQAIIGLPNHTVMSFQSEQNLVDIVFSIKLNATTNRVVMDIDPKRSMASQHMSNSVWFGCPSDICLNAAIDAMIPINEMFYYIFSGNYYWKWDLRDKFTAFSDNKNESKQWKQLSTLFPNSEYPLDAIHCDRTYSECYLYKGDKRKLFSKDLSDKFVFKDETLLNSVGLPDNLDAGFTDENGDQIYVKNNYLFWKEYGILRQKIIQRFYKCRDNYYKNFLNTELNSWQKFSKDIKKYDVINFKELTIPAPTTPKPTIAVTTESPDTTQLTFPSQTSRTPTKDYKNYILIGCKPLIRKKRKR